MASISVLAIGSEILDGRVQDTNSSFIASKVADLGIHPGHFFVCDDTISDIVSCLTHLSSISDLIILSGGLGPTTDDVTRDAVAKFCGKELEFREEEFSAIRKLFERRKRTLYENNRRQALFPKDAVAIKNPIGTAAGFSVELEAGAKKIICLPGVPLELRAMFEETVEPVIREHFKLSSSLKQRMIRIFGLSESEVGTKIEALSIPEEITVSYRAAFPEVQIKLKSEASEAVLSDVAMKVKEAVGADYVFSESISESLEKVVHDLLIKHGKKIATAESCTAGILGELLTRISGASVYYLGGVTTYSGFSKRHLLGVEKKAIDENGEVSEVVAKMMAQGVRRNLQADIGVSITGIAGPSGGTAEKPIGTVFIGLACGGDLFASRYFFSSDRERIRKYSAYSALDVVRRYLSKLPPPDREHHSHPMG